MGTATSTPYDDVFRTLLNDCSELIIPVINEVFGEHYSGNETIIFSPNEHFINGQDGAEEKRITDSCFDIVGEVRKRYLCECQSTPDNSMLVRIFEYMTQIALDDGKFDGDMLEVSFPNSVILFLRSTKLTPDQMKIRMTAENGVLDLDVHIVKAQAYGMEEIFGKNLLFLIPFHIFSYESRFHEYNSNKEKRTALVEEYRRIAEHLQHLQEQGVITTYTHKTIAEMADKVLEHLAAKHKNIREGVKSVMGGKILEYEAKTILKRGIGIGEVRGREYGIAIGREMGKAMGAAMAEAGMISTMYHNGLTVEQIAAATDKNICDVEAILAGKNDV